MLANPAGEDECVEATQCGHQRRLSGSHELPEVLLAIELGESAARESTNLRLGIKPSKVEKPRLL
jgi:hypothetical protein